MCAALLLAILPLSGLHGQVIEFESGGLQYKMETRGGLTLMFAMLPTRILGYAILQVAITNGSVESWVVKPEDMVFERIGGTSVRALPAGAVVSDVLDRAGRGDVGRLITVYESALFGNAKVHSTNGYETRRKDAMAIGGTKLRAAAATSAIVMGTTKLLPGDSTDGAVFFPNNGRPLGAGQLIVDMAGERFVFPMEAMAAEK